MAVLTTEGSPALRGIGPERRQQLLERRDVGIEVDLERFRVIAHGAIGGVLGLPARIANAYANDSRQTPEPGVRPPESPQGERCRPGFPGSRPVQFGEMFLGGDVHGCDQQGGDGGHEAGSNLSVVIIHGAMVLGIIIPGARTLLRPW